MQGAAPVAREGPGHGMGDGRALTLEQRSRVLGGHRWVEQRLFEVLGTWVRGEPLAEARSFFDLQSQRHAAHAALFEDELPAWDGASPDALTVPPTAEVERMLTLLGGGPPATAASGGESVSDPDWPGEGGGTLIRLVGLGRVVLPRLVAGFTRHLERTARVSDGSVIRVLRLVRDDDIEAWTTAEELVQSLVHRPHDIAVITAHQQELESLVAGAGPGLVPLPRHLVEGP